MRSVINRLAAFLRAACSANRMLKTRWQRGCFLPLDAACKHEASLPIDIANEQFEYS